MKDHECSCDETSDEYLLQNNNILLNTLIDLLVEKRVISELELRRKLDDMEKEATELQDTTEQPDVKDSE